MTTQLRGITWDHSRGYDPMVATAESYTVAHPDVHIHWDKRSLQAFADHPLDDLASRYDLIVIDHPHVGSAARGGYLVALDECGRHPDLSTLAEQSVGSSHQSYRYANHQWALAIDAATQVAVYRPDLIDAGELPTTWDHVVSLATAGRVLWPLKPVDAVSSFNTLAANRGTPIAAQHDQIIDKESGRAVLEAMRSVAQHVPRECMTMNPPQTLSWMSRENNEQYAYCPLLYGYTNYARDRYADRLLRFKDIPALGNAGPVGAQLGGTGIAVSSKCEHHDIAVDYAFWIAGAECQRTIFTEASGQPGNAVAWEDDRCNAITHDFFCDTRTTLDGSWVRPTNDGYLDFQDRAGDRINRYLIEDGDIDETQIGLNTIWRDTCQCNDTSVSMG
jgi:multiple sugar transport system substrate-binding protein